MPGYNKKNMRGLQKAFEEGEDEAGGENDPLVKLGSEALDEADKKRKELAAKISGWFSKLKSK